MKTVRFLFNDAMVRAIVEGRKTVTRRPVMPMGPQAMQALIDARGGKGWPCAPGDLLIGRECWCPRSGGSLIIDKLVTPQFYRATDGVGHMKKPSAWPWRPSIHMPDWAARIRRRVASVTVERLHDMSEEDAVREGFSFVWDDAPSQWPRPSFKRAWDAIYEAKGIGWAVNPWVWRIEFAGENEGGPTP